MPIGASLAEGRSVKRGLGGWLQDVFNLSLKTPIKPSCFPRKDFFC